VAATDKLAKHRRYLAEPPADYLEEKLGLFKLKPDDLMKAPSVVICGLRSEARIHPVAGARPKVIDVVSHTKRLRPASLDELKELAGVPTRALTRARDVVPPLPEVDTRALAKLPAKLSVPKLTGAQRTAFFAAGENLLRGRTDAKTLARPANKLVAGTMLKLARDMPMFYAPDLIVCPGQTVTFASYAVLYFNNVVVYGNGRIRLGDNTKLHAYQITHV